MAIDKIQLSEKVEFLMTVGQFTVLKNFDKTTSFHYKSEYYNIVATSVPNGENRFIKFVNWIVEQNNLYPHIQRYLKEKV